MSTTRQQHDTEQMPSV